MKRSQTLWNASTAKTTTVSEASTAATLVTNEDAVFDHTKDWIRFYCCRREFPVLPSTTAFSARLTERMRMALRLTRRCEEKEFGNHISEEFQKLILLLAILDCGRRIFIKKYSKITIIWLPMSFGVWQFSVAKKFRSWSVALINIIVAIRGWGIRMLSFGFIGLVY